MIKIKNKKHEVIIVGAGLASLVTAARLTELGIQDIGIYATGHGGTPYIAAINFVLPDNPYGDTVEQYYEDMLHAGYEINNRDLVKDMTEHTMDGYNLLKRWGINFAQNSDGTTKLRHLSGHTYPRSLCSTTGLIGIELVKKLKEKLRTNGVSVNMGYECVKILENQKMISGITVISPEKQVQNIYAPIVIAGWGGVGNLLGTSTYPHDVKGNILAMAKDAGANLVDIEFLEYEPMVVNSPEGAIGEPCPTAMLGEGAHLLNLKNERFMLNVRPQGESGAPKTLINKQIWQEVDKGNGTIHGGAWVDLRHISREVIKGYPWFYNRLMENGIDPCKELVEVGPMAHSFSGGIQVDTNYQSNIQGFYAVGEACGGAHGACRCAGNAASQATLSGVLCAEAIARRKRTVVDIKEYPAEYNLCDETYAKFAPKIRELAAGALGIYRSNEILSEAKESLAKLITSEDVIKDTRTLQVAKSVNLMVCAALNRKESRGAHMRLDYPETSMEYAKEFTI